RDEFELPAFLAQPQHRRGRRDRDADGDRAADGAPHEHVPIARRAAPAALMFDLGGRAALVTGSTRGLGLAIAAALAGGGGRVAINGRSAEACERAAAGIPGAIAAPFDVTDEAAVAAGIERLAMVDILVNNAGMTRRKPLEEWTLAEWEELFDLNV